MQAAVIFVGIVGTASVSERAVRQSVRSPRVSKGCARDEVIYEALIEVKGF